MKKISNIKKIQRRRINFYLTSHGSRVQFRHFLIPVRYILILLLKITSFVIFILRGL